MTMILQSHAFAHGGEVPLTYTCDGEDISPPLSWNNVPQGTRSLALIVDDPDAPDPAAPRMTWVHWVLFNIPSAATGLPEGGGRLPAGTKSGLNDWMRTIYGGPCPPIGRHRYFFKLYALDRELSFPEPPTKKALEQAMAGHILAKAELMATFQR